jgi:hypothetical protein
VTSSSQGELTPDEAAQAVERLVDRLRSLGLPRLERPADSAGRTPAEVVHATCAHWAVLVHGPHGPEVPELSATAAGDQLAVVGRELVGAWREGRLSGDASDQIARDLAALRAVT